MRCDQMSSWSLIAFTPQSEKTQFGPKAFWICPWKGQRNLTYRCQPHHRPWCWNLWHLLSFEFGFWDQSNQQGCFGKQSLATRLPGRQLQSKQLEFSEMSLNVSGEPPGSGKALKNLLMKCSLLPCFRCSQLRSVLFSYLNWFNYFIIDYLIVSCHFITLLFGSESPRNTLQTLITISEIAWNWSYYFSLVLSAPAQSSRSSCLSWGRYRIASSCCIQRYLMGVSSSRTGFSLLSYPVIFAFLTNFERGKIIALF